MSTVKRRDPRAGRTMLFILLACNVVFLGLLLSHRAIRKEAASEAPKVTMVDHAAVVSGVQTRVDEAELRPEERVVDQMGWQFDVDKALAVAREKHRPVFLFAMYGDLDGKC
ncbi:MAG: hypothetical protein EB084_12400 [Proteobacteria bacterium]|nr:hypothetical protein [Pseudomonadota bacterium]